MIRKQKIARKEACVHWEPIFCKIHVRVRESRKHHFYVGRSSRAGSMNTGVTICKKESNVEQVYEPSVTIYKKESNVERVYESRSAVSKKAGKVE
ncbi:hypothetical protein EV146_101318 [Mesobacillus foraminis]|uniref:Uncharacterized protein n=1 Tax=Mesobacillus foraminis TaxID=279826 RepID=A0A4R2BL58_9BACI|nr:hypothetical protein EV146_101318 [Mesobacillus foraminis]